MNIRKVGEPDIPLMTVARVEYLTELQGERSEAYKEELMKNLQSYFMQAMQEGSFIALLAEKEGRVVSYGGMIIKRIPGDFNRTTYLEGDILNMYTLPGYRRQGISSRILKELLKEAKVMGVSKVALHCSKDGEPLYRKYGFDDPAYPYLERIIV